MAGAISDGLVAGSDDRFLAGGLWKPIILGHLWSNTTEVNLYYGCFNGYCGGNFVTGFYTANSGIVTSHKYWFYGSDYSLIIQHK